MKTRSARACGFVSLALSILILAAAMARAADLSIKPGDQVVRVQIADGQQLDWLIEKDLDVWSHHLDIGPMDVHVSAAERAELDAAGLHYEVLNDDLFSTWLDEQAGQMMRGGDDFLAYKSLDEIYAFIDALAAARPDLCQVTVIGQSLEGRDIRMLHITGPGAGPKPGVFYHGLQHAREWITGSVVLYLADHLVSNYDGDTCIQDLVNRTDFYLVPVMNPDGYSYTWTNVRLWRKNRRPNANGSFGVDLNRNWGYQWGFSSNGSSNNPSSETFRGTAPFSEPETQVMRDFVLSHANVVAHMDYHSYGEIIMWPWGYECVDVSEPDATIFADLGADMSDLIAAVHGHVYAHAPICPGLYPANGSSVDWAYGAAGLKAMTIELRDNGQFGFVLPPDQIIPTCEENLPAILHLSSYASAGIHVRLDGGVPEFLPSGMPATLTTQIREVNLPYMAGTAMLHYRTDELAPFTEVPMSFVDGVGYQASIPPQPCGSEIQFFISAQDASGQTAQWPDPCIGGGGHVSTTAQSRVDVYAEDFESGLGWTTAVVNASAGFWELGVPVNDPGTSNDPPGDSDGSGQCYVTQNVLGNSDVDAAAGFTNGIVRLISPPVDLTGPQTTIEYDYWLRLSHTIGIDALSVEISDGIGPWVEVARHTSFNPFKLWEHGVITPEALAASGLTLRENMRVRFSANDGNPQSTVEAGIDAFRVHKTGCFGAPCPTTPGDMNADELLDGNDLPDFVAAMVQPPFYAPCADLAAPAGILDAADVAEFVALLIGE